MYFHHLNQFVFLPQVLRARGANDFGTAGENHIASPPSPRM
jgi:hypothetical protein